MRLNNIHPTIKFKFEWETNGVLPFLDIKLIRAFGHIKITIYRKPTASQGYIHFFSAHDEQVKRATVSGFFLRAYRLCHPDLLTDEINHITLTFIELQYPLWMIELAHIRARKTYYNSARTKTYESTKFLVMPYTSGLEKLKGWLKSYNVQLAFKYNNTIGKSLIRNKTKREEQVGVYTVPCLDCPEGRVYIGETGRAMNKRVHEHKLDVRRREGKSSFFTHITLCNHRINFDEAKLVYKSENYIERRIVESTLIASVDNFNLSEGNYKLGPFLQTFILKHIRKKLVDLELR